jgi:hypothetical protein
MRLSMSKTPESFEEADLPLILQQLQDLVKILLECEKKDLPSNYSFLEVHKQLLGVRKNIALFQEGYKNALALMGVTPEDIKPTPEEIERLGPKEKKLLKQIDFLRTTCEEARERVYQSLQEDKATLQTVSGELKDKELERTRRKGKFKGVGGKKGWLPT